MNISAVIASTDFFDRSIYAAREYRGRNVKSFRNLDVWHLAHGLVLKCYRDTNSFPKHELYGLTSQIRRCAVSIAANVAEGCGKRGNAEFLRFLGIAAGSASELEYHVLLARDLEFLSPENYQSLEVDVVRVKKMLAGLIRKIESERLSA
jgi:four helix bundle protein